MPPFLSRFYHVQNAGGFGKVYRGTLRDGVQVAIKRLDRKGMQGDKEFGMEASMLCQLRHSNIVTLRGVCVEGDHRCTIFDLAANVSAIDLLMRCRSPCKRSACVWGIVRMQAPGLPGGKQVCVTTAAGVWRVLSARHRICAGVAADAAGPEEGGPGLATAGERGAGLCTWPCLLARPGGAAGAL